MMTISSRTAIAAAFASFLLVGSAYAQSSTAPAKSTTAATTTAKKAAKPRSAASMECSKEADTKGVHGKDRKKFMKQCKKEAKGAAAPASK